VSDGPADVQATRSAPARAVREATFRLLAGATRRVCGAGGRYMDVRGRTPPAGAARSRSRSGTAGHGRSRGTSDASQGAAGRERVLAAAAARVGLPVVIGKMNHDCVDLGW
jgi:hypothetical protein